MAVSKIRWQSSCDVRRQQKSSCDASWYWKIWGGPDNGPIAARIACTRSGWKKGWACLLQLCIISQNQLRHSQRSHAQERWQDTQRYCQKFQTAQLWHQGSNGRKQWWSPPGWLYPPAIHAAKSLPEASRMPLRGGTGQACIVDAPALAPNSCKDQEKGYPNQDRSYNGIYSSNNNGDGNPTSTSHESANTNKTNPKASLLESIPTRALASIIQQRLPAYGKKEAAGKSTSNLPP